MFVLNVWSERGVSVFKRFKIRLRNFLKKEMFESLFYIFINGLLVKEFEVVINKVVALWKEKKYRRKLLRFFRF